MAEYVEKHDFSLFRRIRPFKTIFSSCLSRKLRLPISQMDPKLIKNAIKIICWCCFLFELRYETCSGDRRPKMWKRAETRIQNSRNQPKM